jgi:hypothetical protein
VNEKLQSESPEPNGKASEKWENIAAELTDAVLPVALNDAAGTDSLEKELNLWHEMTVAVAQWDQRTQS